MEHIAVQDMRVRVSVSQREVWNETTDTSVGDGGDGVASLGV